MLNFCTAPITSANPWPVHPDSRHPDTTIIALCSSVCAPEENQNETWETEWARERPVTRHQQRINSARAMCIATAATHNTTQLSRTPKPKNKRLPRARVLYEERGEENGVHRLRRPEEQKTGCRVQGSFERKPKRSKEQNRRKRDSTKRGLWNYSVCVTESLSNGLCCRFGGILVV